MESIKCCRAYGSAEQDDLFTALNDQATVNSVNLPASVKTIMDTWTFQMGYPLITITRNYESGNAVVTQVLFTFYLKVLFDGN